MTTGRINQVTFVRGKDERELESSTTDTEYMHMMYEYTTHNVLQDAQQ